MGYYIKKSEETEVPPLRQKAEELLKRKGPASYSHDSDSETLKLIHELEVHQIELELQNDELKQARAIAQEAAEKYARLYDFAPVGYFTLSPQGTIVELNFCGSQMLGIERLLLLNKPFSSFVSNDTRYVFDRFLEKIFSSKARESCELTLLTPLKPLYVQLIGVAEENGEQCMINAVDITERKQAEKVLIETQRLGAMGEMASSIAHDFNNSLQAISGNLDLAMLDTQLPETTHRHLESVKTAVNDSAERVRLIQRFGEKKQKKAPYALADLNMLVDEVIIQSRPLWKGEAEKKGLSISVITSYGKIPEIYCNQAEIRTVIYNVLKNSIEAMPKGGKIFIETSQKPEGIYLKVIDTGMGMDEKTRASVFQPFYSTKESDKGRGLGMSGALSLMKEHQGNISIKNTTPGKGTIIEIVFPFPQTKEVEETKEAKKIETKAASGSKKQIRVLWVEDDDSILLFLREMAKILALKADIVNNGTEALKHLDQNLYDLVITDIGMPGMNGWQLADAIKEKFGRKIEVAIASGWGDQISEAEKTKHGVTYSINKPFNLDQIRKLLDEIAYGVKL